MLNELKSCFLEAYDDNQDGKIDIRELAQLLPMEENFLLLFRFDNPLESSVEFMKIWREYDSDNSGYIEADELKVNLCISFIHTEIFFICFFFLYMYIFTLEQTWFMDNSITYLSRFMYVSFFFACAILLSFIQPHYTQNFLRDLLKEAKHNNDVSEERLIEYTDIMVSSISHTSTQALYCFSTCVKKYDREDEITWLMIHELMLWIRYIFY